MMSDDLAGIGAVKRVCRQQGEGKLIVHRGIFSKRHVRCVNINTLGVGAGRKSLPPYVVGVCFFIFCRGLFFVFLFFCRRDVSTGNFFGVCFWTFRLSPIGYPPGFSTGRWSIFGLFVRPRKIRSSGFSTGSAVRCQKTDFVTHQLLHKYVHTIPSKRVMTHSSRSPHGLSQSADRSAVVPAVLAIVLTNIHTECGTMKLTTTA